MTASRWTELTAPSAGCSWRDLTCSELQVAALGDAHRRGGGGRGQAESTNNVKGVLLFCYIKKRLEEAGSAYGFRPRIPLPPASAAAAPAAPAAGPPRQCLPLPRHEAAVITEHACARVASARRCAIAREAKAAAAQARTGRARARARAGAGAGAGARLLCPAGAGSRASPGGSLGGPLGRTRAAGCAFFAHDNAGGGGRACQVIRGGGGGRARGRAGNTARA